MTAPGMYSGGWTGHTVPSGPAMCQRVWELGKIAGGILAWN
jgi:hypothetical protein